MNVLKGPMTGWESQDHPNALTIGVFDGVHIGHVVILDRLREASCRSVVLTFDPHPAEVLSPGTHPRLITTIDERIDLLEKAGIGTVGVLDLSEIRHLEPEEFISEVLVDKLGIAALVLGSDFHFGKDRAGDVSYLRHAGERFGFDVEVVELVEDDGIVSSTRIRELIEAGDVAAAATLLGSRYRLTNLVVAGDKRGRAIGFPTANLRPPPRKVIPGHGIYAAFAHVDGTALPAAVSVGVRPTFGGTEVLVEAFILDYEGELYGKPLTLEFVDWLRPELEFDDVESLVEHMNHDVARVRRILEAPVGS